MITFLKRRVNTGKQLVVNLSDNQRRTQLQAL